MEKLSDKAKMYAKTYGQPPYGREIEGTAELLLQMSEKLAEYEDLEEQGKLLKLPCAVGDTVYWVNNWFARTDSGISNTDWHITESKASRFFRSEAGDFMKLRNGENVSVSDFGKTVFLTREAAEAALKELGGRKE